MTILDKHAPFRTIKKRPKFKPWLNLQLREQINKRNRFYKIYKKTDKPKYHVLYKKQAKLVRKIEKNAQREYYAKRFSECKDNA